MKYQIFRIKNEFHIRYINSKTLQVYSQLIKLIDVADCSAEKLFNAFKYEMW